MNYVQGFMTHTFWNPFSLWVSTKAGRCVWARLQTHMFNKDSNKANNKIRLSSRSKLWPPKSLPHYLSPKILIRAKSWHQLPFSPESLGSSMIMVRHLFIFDWLRVAPKLNNAKSLETLIAAQLLLFWVDEMFLKNETPPCRFVISQLWLQSALIENLYL